MARVSDVIVEDACSLAAELRHRLQPLAGRTFLVTGAAGFLCSYVLDAVVAANDAGLDPPCRLIALDNFLSGVADRVEHLSRRKDVRLVRHDITRPFEPGDPVHWILHGASIASPTFYRRYPLETIDANVLGTRHLLELARRGTSGMVMLSTSEVYGDPDPACVPTSEDYNGNVSCTGPRAPYDESKRLAETLCATYHRLYGIPVRTVRPFNVYGPGQRLDDRRILPDLMAAALERKAIVLHSDGRATRSFCYVKDAVRALLVVLLEGANGQAYNIGNDEEEVCIADLAQHVRELAGPPWLAVVHEMSQDRHYLTDNPQRRRPDLTRLRTLIPDMRCVKLRQGLERTLRSYRAEVRI
ncbi:MAG: NAD-dependent epimerase/dehydratase family protein [Chloroflexi bacterium]|nr:NAD-dependent epimerase/dehydratase family protein [Chloroflexota bacterium]